MQCVLLPDSKEKSSDISDVKKRWRDCRKHHI